MDVRGSSLSCERVMDVVHDDPKYFPLIRMKSLIIFIFCDFVSMLAFLIGNLLYRVLLASILFN